MQHFVSMYGKVFVGEDEYVEVGIRFKHVKQEM
jgi:hypothetical protein